MILPLAALAADNPLLHVVDGHLGFDPESAGHPLWTIGLTKHVFMFLLGGVGTVLFFWGYSKDALDKKVPGRWGNFVEMILLFLRDQLIRPFMGTHGDRYLPLLATFFVFIAITNLLGLVPFFDLIGHGGNTATGNFAVTVALAVVASLAYHVSGIKEQGGFGTYFKSLFPHVPLVIMPIIIPIELAAHVIRPGALAVRLFANMLAGHTMVAAIIGFTAMFGALGESAGALTGGFGIAFVSAIAVTLLTFLEMLVALIQAFVFTFLTTVFLSMAVHPEH